MVEIKDDDASTQSSRSVLVCGLCVCVLTLCVPCSLLYSFGLTSGFRCALHTSSSSPLHSFGRLEELVGRILVAIDLHVCHVALLGRDRLIDLHEASGVRCGLGVLTQQHHTHHSGRQQCQAGEAERKVDAAVPVQLRARRVSRVTRGSNRIGLEGGEIMMVEVS